jgi:hypothetical protein
MRWRLSATFRPSDLFLVFLMPLGTDCDAVRISVSSGGCAPPGGGFGFVALGFLRQLPFGLQPILKVAPGLSVFQVDFVGASADLIFSGFVHGRPLIGVKATPKRSDAPLVRIPNCSPAKILLWGSQKAEGRTWGEHPMARARRPLLLLTRLRNIRQPGDPRARWPPSEGTKLDSEAGHP